MLDTILTQPGEITICTTQGVRVHGTVTDQDSEWVRIMCQQGNQFAVWVIWKHSIIMVAANLSLNQVVPSW